MSDYSAVFPGASASAISDDEPQKQQQAHQGEEEKQQQEQQPRKKRNLPGHPDPDAQVIALSPKTLMATNRFVCEVCSKGFQRDQNLQLHRRGHNLPWKLRQRDEIQENSVKKRVYICPEPTCVHHDPSRALGDLTGIKKHYYRKHGEKKWKCDRCSKQYAIYSDWKAHQKICGVREYRCGCGTLFSRRDSFISHRAFCDGVAREKSQAAVPTRIIDESDDPYITACNMGPGELVTVPDDGPSSRALELMGSRMEICPSLDVSDSFVVVGGGGASTTSKWMCTTLGTAPSLGLSLCLGMGIDPDPGSSCTAQATQNQALVLQGIHSITAEPSYVSSSVYYAPDPPCSRTMFANLALSTAHLSQPCPPSLIASPPGLASNFDQDFSGHDFSFSNASFKSPPYRNASASISATALLQKAALMGSTANNDYLRRVVGYPSSYSWREQSAGVGPSRVVPKSLPVQLAQKTSDILHSGIDDSFAVLSFDQGVFSMKNPSACGPGILADEYVGAGAGSSRHLSSFMNVGHLSSFMNVGENPLGPCSEGHRMPSSLMQGLPYVPDCAQFESVQRRESGEDRPLLDFLGVGAPTMSVGTAAGSKRSLSHQELIRPSTRIKVEPSFDEDETSR